MGRMSWSRSATKAGAWRRSDCRTCSGSTAVSGTANGSAGSGGPAWAWPSARGWWRLTGAASGPRATERAWEGFLQSLYRRGLEGKNLQLIVTDGCAGLAAAIQTVYSRVAHQRCWVHKMRNILQKVRKRDYDAVKADAQAIYRAESLGKAQRAFQKFQVHWREAYPAIVRQLEKDLPELLSFFQFPRHLWRKLRTTNVIERCFVEVRRRTRPMVCFVNVQSVDRIVFSIFNRMNPQWKNRTLQLFTQAA